jgi:undecaprenyl-diphosphatase
VHLAVGLALSAGCTAFVVIAEEVLGGGELVQFDLAFAEALRETTSASWERRFAAVTRLGNTDVLAAAVVVVAIGLIATGRRMMAAGWALSQAGGGVLNATLKELFERTRPDYADPILTSGSWSFPSGHAMGTFIACGVGAYLVLRSVSGWGARATVVVIALAWSLVMSFSRLYLGVHYASDVVAGLVAGVAWVAVCVSGFELAFGRSRPAMR